MSNNKNQVPLNDKKQTRVVEVVERPPAAQVSALRVSSNRAGRGAKSLQERDGAEVQKEQGS